MAGKPPPPSFSSFPDLSKPRAPPPSFSSFPEPRPPPRDEDARPSKRAKATEFLDGIEDELEGRSESKRREHRSERDGYSSRRESDREESSRRSSKSKGKERAREEDDRERKGRHKESRRSKRKDRERAVDRDSDYGEKRSKPYQLVQADSRDAVPRGRSPSPPPADKPLFYSSRQPDDLNVRYGGIHKGDIPRYRRLGAGRVLGLNDGLRITKETAYTGRGVEVGPIRRFVTPRYSDARSARHTTNKHFKRINLAHQAPRPLALGEKAGPHSAPPPPDPFLSSSSDPSRFVPFEVERSMAEKLGRLEHEEGQDYRSIAGMVKPADLADEEEDDMFGGLGVVGGESQEDYLKRRNLDFDRALRDEPSNVALWIEFVNFQDEVSLASFVGTATKRALSKAERTSTSEIKLSILDRALAVERNRGSEPLLLAYLRAAAEVWDAKKVLERWSETLRSHPTLTGLWIEYVSWRQTNWVNFGVREVVEVFEESFRVLAAAAEKEQLGSQGRELLEANAIYLFLRLCLMLRQAGFSERALAAFQAIIELNLFRPEKDSRPQRGETEKAWRERVLGGLETFWDSEVARVGEKDAKGWRNTTDDAEPLEGAADAFPSSPLEEDSRGLERWASTEQLVSVANPRPARTTDPGIDDDVDPFRVVLFEDIRDFLFVIHSPDSQLQLVYAFLTFLGLPFIPVDMPTSTPFSTDSFIHSELVERPHLMSRFWPKIEEHRLPFALIAGEAMEPERKSALTDPFDTPFHSTPTTVDLLFSAKQKWFLTLKKEDLRHVDVELARNTLALLRLAVPDSFLTLDFFAFEATQSPKAAVKLAKQVLRDSRQNLVLWDGYARIERQRGKVQEARQVYITALSMYRSFSTADQIDGPLLWRAWAEMEWEEGKPLLALKVLVAASSVDDVDLTSLAKVDAELRPSPASILRAREYYTTQLESSFQPQASQAIIRGRNHIASAAALFEYLSRGLMPATEVFEQHLFRLDCSGAQGSAEHEEAYMSYVKLLYRHASAGRGYKPGQLREVLERAISEFPSNTLFLSVFYHNELRSKIHGRVRRTLEDAVLKKDATSEGWLFAIFAELHLDARSPSKWGVRNLFDRALEDPKTRSSASLWSLYIDFEIRNGELKRAKGLIYRAVRDCPWCKELYLRPFLPALRSVYRSQELRDWHSLLLEKGLRVRVEVDDFAEVGSDVEMVDPPLEGFTDAEGLLAEREYLKPY